MDLPYRIKDTESDTDIRDQDALHRSVVYLKCDKNNYTEEDTPYGIYHAMHSYTVYNMCKHLFSFKNNVTTYCCSRFLCCAYHIN